MLLCRAAADSSALVSAASLRRVRSSVRSAVQTASESRRRSRRSASVRGLAAGGEGVEVGRAGPAPQAWVTAIMCRAVLTVWFPPQCRCDRA
jgi:hypothetical protein